MAKRSLLAMVRARKESSENRSGFKGEYTDQDKEGKNPNSLLTETITKFDIPIEGQARITTPGGRPIAESFFQAKIQSLRVKRELRFPSNSGNSPTEIIMTDGLGGGVKITR